MKRKLLSLLVLLMTAATGAWAGDHLYLDNISGTTATLKCSDSAPDDKPYFSFGSWEGNGYSDIDNFISSCTKITVDASDFDGDDLSCLFQDWGLLETIDNIDELNTTYVTDMASMFAGCSSLTTLDLSSWDTGNVEYMLNMFWGCSSLSSLDLSDWDTSSVEDMAGMFEDCSSLSSLDLSDWDTGNVTDMSNMFTSCSSLTTLTYGSGWDTGNVEYMDDMFNGCSSLSTLNLSGWDTGKVEDMSYMFFNCQKLETLNITGWDTSSVTNSDEMFDGCTKLYKSVTLKEGATDEYWATFYDETTGYNYQAPEGTQVFKVNLSGNEIEMTEIDDRIVKSGQGVVLKNTSDDITLTPTIETSADDYSGNSLKGTTTEINTTGPNNYYVLNKKTAGVGFYKLSNTNGTIGANKAYLTYTAGAREFFLFDEATGIEGVSVSDGENGEVYDLQGRRVSQPAKGLYIVRSAEGRLQGKNGKKVIINK